MTPPSITAAQARAAYPHAVIVGWHLERQVMHGDDSTLWEVLPALNILAAALGFKLVKE